MSPRKGNQSKQKLWAVRKSQLPAHTPDIVTPAAHAGLCAGTKATDATQQVHKQAKECRREHCRLPQKREQPWGHDTQAQARVRRQGTPTPVLWRLHGHYINTKNLTLLMYT
jgi:hypothetical protein